MTDTARTYDLAYTNGNTDEVEAENYQYIVKDDVSNEPLPSALGRVVFVREGRPVMTVNASTLISVRERAL